MAQSPLANLGLNTRLDERPRLATSSLTTTLTHLPARPLDLPELTANTRVSPEFQQALQAIATYALDEGISLAETKAFLDFHFEGKRYSSSVLSNRRLTRIV